MAAKAPTTRMELFALLRDAALARPTARGWIVPVFQFCLILILQPVIFFVTEAVGNATIVPASHFWYRVGLVSHYAGSVSAFPENTNLAEVVRAVPFALIAIMLEGVVAWIPFRIVTRHSRVPLELFLRSWWRTWLWGLVVLPTGAFVFGVLPQVPGFETTGGFALAAYLLLGPAGFARAELRRHRRRSRWRPVCPECGYSLRRLRGDRCPECGVAFPTTSRVFRRWAFRRLIWERVQRGTVLFAYIKTVLTIVFWPCRAARGVAVPDRGPRAVRWAIVHLVVLALAGVALGSNLYFPRWVQAWFAGSMWAGWDATGSYGPTAARVALWAGQSLGAWLITLAALPLLGVALGYAVPGRHPAAKRGIAKWSLYLSTVLVGVFLAAYVFHFLDWLWFPRVVAGFGIGWYPPRLPVGVLAVAYGVWWAIGVSVNPYFRVRGFGVFLVHAALFVLSWLVLTAVLFPAGAFGSLL
jgi:hypothetical protein